MDGDVMCRFPVPDRDNLPDDLCEYIDDEIKHVSFAPNVFAAFTYEPSHFRPFSEYHDVFVEDTDLERYEVKMITMTVSGADHCYYCNAAHDALVRVCAKDPLPTDQLVANYRTADIPGEHKTIFDVTVKLTESPVEIDGDDLQRLRDAGFSKEVIRGIGVVAAFFSLNNRMAMFIDMRPNEEFHALGRKPRSD